MPLFNEILKEIRDVLYPLIVEKALSVELSDTTITTLVNDMLVHVEALTPYVDDMRAIASDITLLTDPAYSHILNALSNATLTTENKNSIHVMLDMTTTKAAEALLSANNAALSETNAADSANSAENSANNAANSADNAAAAAGAITNFKYDFFAVDEGDLIVYYTDETSTAALVGGDLILTY